MEATIKETLMPEFIDGLCEGPLRLLEPLEQQIFCQRVEQHWEGTALKNETRTT